jgi:hypothetical protein
MTFLLLTRRFYGKFEGFVNGNNRLFVGDLQSNVVLLAIALIGC